MGGSEEKREQAGEMGRAVRKREKEIRDRRSG